MITLEINIRFEMYVIYWKPEYFSVASLSLPIICALKTLKNKPNEVIKNDLITDQGLNIEHGLIDL